MMREDVLSELPSVARLIAQGFVTGIGRPGAQAGLPPRAVVLPSLAQDVDRLAAYDHLCGFPLRDRVPPTWLHVLTFPLQAHVIAARDFPFPLAGLVHVTNDMTLHRPVTVADRLRLRCHAENLAPHRKGVTFDMVGEIRVGDEVVWTGVSNYLAPGATMPGTIDSAPRLEAPAVAPSARWRLPADLGRRYAAVSGDCNPLHLWPATARLFGFRRPIIHGMWTHGRALAALEPRLGDTYRVRVRFTKPILLPATVEFGAGTGPRPSFAVTLEGGGPVLAGEGSDARRPDGETTTQ